MYACSLIANSETIGEFKEAVRNLFIMLSYQTENEMTRNSQAWVKEKCNDLGNEKIVCMDDSVDISEDEKIIFSQFHEDLRGEEKSLRQCKKNRFYELAFSILEDVKQTTKMNRKFEYVANKYYSEKSSKIHYRQHDGIVMPVVKFNARKFR